MQLTSDCTQQKCPLFGLLFAQKQIVIVECVVVDHKLILIS